MDWLKLRERARQKAAQKKHSKQDTHLHPHKRSSHRSPQTDSLNKSATSREVNSAPADLTGYHMTIYWENPEVSLVFDDFANEFARDSLGLGRKAVNQSRITKNIDHAWNCLLYTSPSP